jgi:hypothetical protein
MREHPAYQAAKSGQNSAAALALVYDFINDAAVDELRAHLISDADKARVRVVGVHAQESSGRNRIPLAYAEALAKILNVVTDPGIVQSSIANHGGAASIYHRMVSQPIDGITADI